MKHRINSVSFNEANQKFIRGEISKEDYLTLLEEARNSSTPKNFEVIEDPGFFQVLDQSFQELVATGGAGIRVLGEAFDNQSLIDYGNSVVENREAQAARYGRPMTVEDIDSLGDAADWLFTNAIPQVIPSLLASVPLAVIGGIGGAAALPAIAGLTALRAGQIGAGLGAFLPSSFLGAGEIDREMKRRVDEGFEDPLAALGGGAIVGALDTAALAFGLKGVLPQLIRKKGVGRALIDDTVDELVKRGVPPNVGLRAAAQGLAAAVAEGTTEASQEFIIDLLAEANTGVSSDEEELTSSLLNSFALGVVGGGPLGVIAGKSRAKTLKENYENTLELAKIDEQAKADTQTFIDENNLEDLNLIELQKFAADKYGFEETIDDQVSLLERIKLEEETQRRTKGYKEFGELSALPENDLADRVETEIIEITQQTKDGKILPGFIRQQARDINPNFDGSYAEAVEIVAANNVQAAFIRSGNSKATFNKLTFDRYKKLLKTNSKQELAIKASQTSPHLFPTVEQAAKETNSKLAEEIAKGQLAIEISNEQTTFAEKQTPMSLDMPQNESEAGNIEANIINLKDPKQGEAIGFSVRDGNDILTFKKKAVLDDKNEIVSYNYEEDSGRTFDEFKNTKELGKKRDWKIVSYNLNKGKGYRFKENFLAKAITFLGNWLAPTGPTGQSFFIADRKRLGRERAINKAALMLSYSYDDAANAAVIEDGQFTTREAVDELVVKYLNKEIRLSDLPTNLQGIALQMRSTMDTLSTRILKELPESVLEQKDPSDRDKTKKEVIETMLGQYFTRSYKIFDPARGWNPSSIFGKRNKEQIKAKEVAVNYILNNSERFPGIVTKEQASQKVDEIIKATIKNESIPYEQLGLVSETDTDTEVVSPAKRVLNERTNIPKEFRFLFGEFKNPAEILAATVSKVAKYVENYKFYDELLRIDQEPGERLFTTTPQGKYSVKVPLEDTPLDNLYTTKEVAEALSLNREKESTFYKYFYPLVILPKGVLQSFKTVFSPMAQMRNFTSASMFYMANGHFHYKDFPITMKAIGSELSGTGYDSQGRRVDSRVQAEKLYNKLTRLGVVNTSVRLGEIIQIFDEAASGGYRTPAEFTAYLASKGEGKVGKSFSFLKQAGRQPVKLYTAADDFWKIASFLAERRKFSKIFTDSDIGLEQINTHTKNLGFSTKGLDYTDALDELSAYNVRNTIPNYDYVGKFVQFLRRTPFAPFVAFPTEIFRTTGNIIKIATAEIRSDNSKLKTRGYTRLFGFGSMMAGIPLAAVAYGMAETGADEEDIQAIRRMGPSWIDRNLIIPIRKRTEKEGGGFDYVDGSHLLVYDTVAGLALGAIRDIKEGEGNILENSVNGVANAVYNTVKLYTDLSIAPKLQLELLLNRKELGQGAKIAELEDGLGSYFEQSIDYAWSRAQPGFWQQTKNLVSSGTFDEASFSKYGTRKEFEDAMLNFIGVKINTVDPTQSIPFKITEAQKRFNNASRTFVRLSKQSGDVSASDLIEAYKKAQRAFFDIQKELHLDIKAAQRLNVKNSVLNTNIRRLNPVRLRSAVRNGVFVPFVPPASSQRIYNQNTKKMEKAGALISKDRYYPIKEINDIKGFYLRNKLNLGLDFYLPKED